MRSIAARELNPTFHPRWCAPDDSCSRRIEIWAAIPFATRWSAGILAVDHAASGSWPRNRDILISSVVAALAGAITLIANFAQWGLMFGGFGGRDERDGGRRRPDRRAVDDHPRADRGAADSACRVAIPRIRG